ncbi:P-loop NTPase fold protein [Streptomyces ipomoeae]|uniref:P-loop NTPase fold protein n=1 Tax=Streptomyces ipomoeae TaxID=103232 RepID=UPI00031CF7F3|nr:P-loop NTPase fold protein [Streptomyces ipomoeae]MDX2695342.1 P-loop NTPase fold protein [Streptomyces ipomoeae]MDX2822640.1 P-loop NTPase fold protein [Streptomyces ipomoeae]MDX2841336.1 P-loop NTPase fold protein [Streptomyces ipomoeae]MDX2875256.1 P-loop NTPase fold protein [Streptomyces ipomoeae]
MSVWDEEPDCVRTFYDLAVEQALKHDDIRAYLSLNRQEITKSALREVMREDAVADAVLDREERYERLWRLGQRLDRSHAELRTAVARCVQGDFLPTVFLAALIRAILSGLVGMAWWGDLLLLSWVALAALAEFHEPTGRSNFTHQLWAAFLSVRWCRRAVRTYPYLAHWAYFGLSRRLVPVMSREITNLLGPEHDSLLVTRHHRGLLHAHDPSFWVSSRVEVSLRHKLDQMDGGAIALCGPRGVGKTTLLRKACEGRLDGMPARNHFRVIVQTPANYRPEEFLLSLFQQVCRSFLERLGERAREPFLLRLRPTGLFRRFIRFIRELLLLSAGLLLLATGLESWARGTYRWAGSEGREATVHWLGRIQDAYHSAWQEHPGVTRALFIAVGLLFLARSITGPLFASRRQKQLISDCRSHLHLLRHMQTAGLTHNAGITAMSALTFGLARTSGSSSRPLTYPELVTQFRELLARISEYIRDDRDHKVFIGIDELDRLGSTEQARAFLAEIKAIFAIPNVYFLLSVSEDVGATFIRRGLPVRDVTDSSLEDILHMEPRTLEEAKELLQTRVPGFTDPFVALVYVLSGGIPRDLIRFTRKVIEIRHRTDETDLRSIAGRLLLEEVTETLSSFRVVLGSQPHDAAWGVLLHDLHGSVDRLRMVRPGRDVRKSLHRELHRLSSGDAPADDDLRAQWVELTAYMLFAMTVVDVFIPRRSADETGPNRLLTDTARLKELGAARLELGVSADSARLALERLRGAWQLHRVRPHGTGAEGSSHPDGEAPSTRSGPPSMSFRQRRRRRRAQHLTRADVRQLLGHGVFGVRGLTRRYPDFPRPDAHHGDRERAGDTLWSATSVYSWAAQTPAFALRGALLLRPLPSGLRPGSRHDSTQTPYGPAIDWATDLGIVRVVHTTDRGAASAVAASLAKTRDTHGIVTVCTLYGDLGITGPALWAADTAHPYIEYEASWGVICALAGQPLPWWPSRLRLPELVTEWRPGSEPSIVHVPADEDETTLRQAAQNTALPEEARTALLDMANVMRNQSVGNVEGEIRVFGQERRGTRSVIIGAHPDVTAHPIPEVEDRALLTAGWKAIGDSYESDAAAALRVARAYDPELLPYGAFTEIERPDETVERWIERLVACDPTAGHVALARNTAADAFFTDPLTGMPALRTDGDGPGRGKWRFCSPLSLPANGQLASVVLRDTAWVTTDEGLVLPAPCAVNEHLWWGDGWGDRPTEIAYVVALLLDDLRAVPDFQEQWSSAPKGLVRLFSQEHPPGTELPRATLLHARLSSE